MRLSQSALIGHFDERQPGGFGLCVQQLLTHGMHGHAIACFVEGGDGRHDLDAQ